MKNKFKEFFATSWAIDNRTSIYVLTIIITMLGLVSYFSIPKEQFPEVVIPTVLVTTPYPGTSPEDMESLITRPIEKEIKSLADVDKVTSNSLQDFSSIVVEFNTDVPVEEAKQRVKDAVDKAKADLPNDLMQEPEVAEIDFAEIPIMFINISGDYDLQRLKKYAEIAQDRIEMLREITRVDIIGALEREIRVDVDMYKMQAAGVTFSDIERAIASENVTISTGSITNFGTKRTIRVVGQFERIDDVRNILFKSSTGANVYLKDISGVEDSYKEQESFSRLDNKPVITLNVIKKSGQNLIDASDKIKEIINVDLIKNVFPPDLKVTISGDMSRYTRNTLEELNNTILIGFLLVTLVLMFFMGFNNAFFVGLSVPLSMFVAYMIMPSLGFTMNMIVMFGFIFALGIIVDDAIVVIENTHRIHRKVPDIVTAAKMAAGQVFLPILSGTLTTLAPFFPLAFWPGIVGKFMYYIPVTLILTLFASLFVAYIINPVFAVSFMKHEYDEVETKVNRKRILIASVVLLMLALLCYFSGVPGIGNLLILLLLLNLLYRFFIKQAIGYFQNTGWPATMHLYERSLRFFLKKNNPQYMFWSIIVLLIITFIITGAKKPKVLFFPENEPNNIFVSVAMPEGTDQLVTDSVTQLVEKRIFGILGKTNPAVESVISNVGFGAGESIFDRSMSSNRGKVTVNFIESKYRQDISTTQYMNQIRDAVKDIPGTQIVVQKNQMGPPTGKPVNIEIRGEDLGELVTTGKTLEAYLDSVNIEGVENLKMDFVTSKPEIIINIDRERANREGIFTGQVGLELRTAIYGKEVSKYKEQEDEFPIVVRYSDKQRRNINEIINSRITYRDMNSGQLRSIPISSLATITYKQSYGGIKRLNNKRVITLSSEVLSGYTPNEVVANAKAAIRDFQTPRNFEIAFTGEQEYQQESTAFLTKAMLIALGLIFFILITQFKSLPKSLIILSEVIFSIIGVLIGIIIFNMPIVITMTGLGVVALGGIVVRNGILIVEFADRLREQGLCAREAIVRAGLTRTTPVVLTATATMLGLVPLAVGMNINFVTMFTELNPHLFFGGDNVAFWGALSWTIIFGLSFATFLTIIFVPAMYLMDARIRLRIAQRKKRKAIL